ncbi:MAG: VWA domain-containing protein [Oscillospiraceae bacterium]|nr:VWA domain-containing protein [Oscillospiraceae bacterium]
MGIINYSKTFSTTNLECEGSFQINLALAAGTDIRSGPADIVLLIDRSGDMSGAPIANIKNGANALIDAIAEATDGTESGQIGYGSRISIVSFAGSATTDTELITDVSELKEAVNNIQIAAGTNVAAGFTMANEVLQSATNTKIIVLFTNGLYSSGGNASNITAQLRAAGTTIFVFGLSAGEGINETAIANWASKPSSAFVNIEQDGSGFADFFDSITGNLQNVGATNITITDTVSPCFRITGTSMPTQGQARLLDNNTVQWTIEDLGTDAIEGVELTFTVESLGTCTGELQPNQSTVYTDTEDNVVDFPSPTLAVDCTEVVIPEGCPEPIALAVDGCQDTVELDAGNLVIDSLGCIASLDVTLQDVCPNKRVALAVILTEVDEDGTEYNRGMKTMVIPAHTREFCTDVTVRCIKFVLPASLSVAEDDAPCAARNFNARFLANYIDSGFTCCSDNDDV